MLLVSSAAATDSAFVSDNDVAITRAQVRKELAQPERAGYRPGRANDPHYPETIQAALARIHVDDRVAGDASLSDYGNAAEAAVSTMIAALRGRLAMRYTAGLCRESMSTPVARAIVAVNAPTENVVPGGRYPDRVCTLHIARVNYCQICFSRCLLIVSDSYNPRTPLPGRYIF
ncbi:DUF4148 domain-containing protein [Burkholderia pseudomultivorans]|uniref:DUF4148 domain-containing protein n=1 Tax=Burkholderia pseudomultivorans TaxID=1207504 RepID=UPI0028765216|nr:DUF4148 domain-containing protein [Burkholderia pseudomultivorans]MDS0794235.1 DUF4148 domain-containing protein [Burkholderia pseudomultivorans]